MAEEIISELEEMSTETYKIEKELKKTEQSIQELWANYKRCNRSVIGNTRRRRKKGNNNG